MNLPERLVKLKVYEDRYKDQILTISGSKLEDFYKEKLENKKLLAKKMVKSKIQITTDHNLVILTIKHTENNENIEYNESTNTDNKEQ